MKIRLAEYLARLFAANGITRCFAVTGGGAMHLNDGFGHEKGITTLYMHHEQAAAMAAECYARIYNKPALLSVTTGPGGTNAVTGVLGAWLDSIPMIVVSGQVRYDNTARSSGVGIRSMGDQEYDILRAVDCMTKYSRMIIDPYSVRYEAEKCLWLSQTGRPGPCWLDIPVDIQGTFIDDSLLVGFDPDRYTEELQNELDSIDTAEEAAHSETRGEFAFETLTDSLLNISFRKQYFQSLPEHIEKDSPVIDRIIEKISSAKRPIFYTGNGIRIAGAESVFLKVADQLGIPVVVGWNGIDIIPEEHPLKAGQPGGRGDRPGNLAAQNADLIFSVGSRLSIRQVGYNFRTWARAAYTIVCDIDEEELKKPSVHIDMPLHTDARELLEALSERLEELGFTGHGGGLVSPDITGDTSYPTEKTLFQGGVGKRGMNWIEQCRYWMKVYHPYQEKFAAHGADEPANAYFFLRRLSEHASENQITVVGNGTPCCAGTQVYRIKRGSRYISQDGVAAMGYDLPAAIGAACATHFVPGRVFPSDCPEPMERDLAADKASALGEIETAKNMPCWAGRKEHYPEYYRHDIILPTGDGSVMMNLQELQTISSHRLPIKIFLINNGGYHSIRQTQTHLFAGRPLVGVGVDSGDLSFPDFEKIAAAFGLPYFRIDHNTEVDMTIEKALSVPGPVLTEVFVSLDQGFEPANSAKKHPDGSLSSPPLEDMSPFLSDEEMDANMYIPRVRDAEG